VFDFINRENAKEAFTLYEQTELRKQTTKIIGEILRYLRKKEKLSQKDIADKLNIAQQTYATYENGHYEPNIFYLIQLANFYKVTLDFISGRLYEDWFIEPRIEYKLREKPVNDMIEHSKRQYEDAYKLSHIILDNVMHNVYL